MSESGSANRHRADAAIAIGGGRFEIAPILVHSPARDEVLVQLRASGICHTDADHLRSESTPFVMGHEGAGVVRQVGAGVQHVKPGDPVLLTWAIACGHCFQCVRGSEVLCETYGRDRGAAAPGSTQRPSGESVPRFFSLGTMSTMTVVRKEAVVLLPQDIPFTSACILGCAVMTGYGSVVNAAKVRPGSSVTVIGCGGVGLNVIQAARIAGATQIVAIDVNPGRFRLARELGATATVLADRSDRGLLQAAATVQGLCGGRGSDYAFECTGNALLGASPLACIRDGGTAVQVSGIETEVVVDMALFEWDKLYLNPLYGQCRPTIDFPALFELYRSGRLQLDSLVTRTYPLQDLAEALQHMKTGSVTKAVLAL